MAINGIETLLYGVESLEPCTRFFEDFGLPLLGKSADHAHFRLEEGSNVLLRRLGDPAIAASGLVGTGVQETIWGVETHADLDHYAADLSQDHTLRRDGDGTIHLVTRFGLAIGLRVFQKRVVTTAPEPLNSPGNVSRLNRQRKWYARTRPRTINHVVFSVPDHEAAGDFFRERLNFRLSDRQQDFGLYLRAEGARNHHTTFLANGRHPALGGDGKLRFHHANFGVEDIDELMTGVNHMERRGWPKSHLGLGRHRVDSALFCYLPCPAGGEAEYGTDSDVIDDSWIPRNWEEPLFGYATFVHNLPPFLREAPPWNVRYLQGYLPSGAGRGETDG